MERLVQFLNSHEDCVRALFIGIHLFRAVALRNLEKSQRAWTFFLTSSGVLMNSKWRVTLPLISLLGVLGGCAGPMPKPDPHDSWVSLREEPDAVLMAGDLDGKRLNDGRYFEVPPGKHRLDLSLIIDGVGDDDERNCRASVRFDQFTAGGHYRLEETSLGQDYEVKLEDSKGKQLGKQVAFTCLPS